MQVNFSFQCLNIFCGHNDYLHLCLFDHQYKDGDDDGGDD